jgi:5'-nucleotidase
MPFPIESKLVVGVASSALFDLRESDEIFREKGEAEYRAYQRRNESVVLRPGSAFPLIRRLLELNRTFPDEQPVEVVLLSKNDPDTGLRVFKSIEHFQLPISRAAFVSGRDPFRYTRGFNACLFLSANPDDVRRAMEHGLPAGCIFPGDFVDDENEAELRIAFDFDGVLADDSAERIYQEGQLPLFHATEREHATVPLPSGPLQTFFSEIARLQRKERDRQILDPGYEPRIRTAIVTARNAPAHERLVMTLRSWGIQIDEAFFLGGIEKSRILAEFRPHIFFDDQQLHVQDVARIAPSVHIPFGITNVIVAAVEASDSR